MKLTNAAISLFVLALCGAAQAGDRGAGPAAAAGPGVGSIITPGSHSLLSTPWKDDRNRRVLPGNGGLIQLTGDQIAQTATALRAFEGAAVEGAMIRAQTVLADGTPAVIALNTQTGRLTVTRR